MDWKDCTQYSRDDKKRVPGVWTYQAGGIIVCVHRHIHYPKDQWLLSCEPFYNQYELPHIDINEAKQAALDMVSIKLRDAVEMFNRNSADGEKCHVCGVSEGEQHREICSVSPGIYRR